MNTATHARAAHGVVAQRAVTPATPQSHFHATRGYAGQGYAGSRNARRRTAWEGTATQSQAARGNALQSNDHLIPGSPTKGVASHRKATRRDELLCYAAPAPARCGDANRSNARRTAASSGKAQPANAVLSNEPLFSARRNHRRRVASPGWVYQRGAGRGSARHRVATHSTPRNTDFYAWPRHPAKAAARRRGACSRFAVRRTAEHCPARLSGPLNTKPRNFV